MLRANFGETRRTRLAVAAIVLVAAAVRLWGIHFGLPHLNARPDEGAIVAIAGGMRGGDFNPHFFNYPALFMLAVALGWFALDVMSTVFPPLNLWMDAAATTTPYRIARYISAAAGIASVLFLFRVGERLFGVTTALASAALLALAFLHVRDSHFGVTDVPMTFLVLVAFYYIVRRFESGQRADLIAAGVASGLATSTKYNAVLIALPALAAIVLEPPGRRRSIGTRFWDAALYASLLVGAFLLTSPYSVLEFRRFIADVVYESKHLAGGHGIVLTRGWHHHATFTLRHGLGLPMLCAGVFGMLLLLVRDRRKGILVALFPVSYYALLGSGYTVFARYMLPVIPFVCLTAAYGVTETARWLAARADRPSVMPTLVTVAIAAILWPSGQSVVRFDRIISQTDSRVLARQWLDRTIPPGATIAQVGAPDGDVLLFERDRSELKYRSADISRPGSRPDVVIVNASPLGEEITNRVRRILSREYDAGFFQHAAASDPRNVYDWQDQFFVPLSGFEGIERPGPNVGIYLRRDFLPHVARIAAPLHLRRP